MITEVLLWMACAEQEILLRCPSERRKLAALGSLVAATSALASASATFTAHGFLHAPLALALLVGFGWGGAMLIFDRWMMVSIRRQPSRIASVIHALPRVTLALVAGMLVAPPITLLAFAQEVRTQAHEDKQNELLAGRHALEKRYGEIAHLQDQATAIQTSIAASATGAYLSRNSAYRLASREAVELRGEARQARRQALCELDGTCGTDHIGEGPVYARKAAAASRLEAQATQAEEHVRRLRHRLLGEETANAGQARAFAHRRLATIEGRLDRLRSERASQEAGLRGAYKRPVGLADRLDALAILAGRHPSVGRWGLLLTLLILCFDAGPAIGKALMVIGEPTLYELEADRYEQTVREMNDLGYEADIDAQREEAQIAVDAAKLKRQTWSDRQAQIVERAVSAEVEITLLYLADWERRARRHSEAWSEQAFSVQARPQEQDRGAGRQRAGEWRSRAGRRGVRLAVEALRSRRRP